MRTSLHFLPWDRPLPAQAAAYLAREWSGGAPLDLSQVLVVVQTRQSGRRLREALATHAAARGQAAFPPRVFTPDALIAQGLPAGTASRLESLLAWTEVFRALGLENFREVFPVEPPARNFTWACRLGQEFIRLQATLAEAGLRLGDVAEKAGPDFPERERWRQIRELERLYDEKLAALGLRDAQAEKIRLAATPRLPEGIERIVMMAVPDPLPLALTWLEHAAAIRPVEIVVFASEAEAANFDAWGRASPAAWARRELVLAEFERHVQLCADPAAQARRIVAVAQNYGEPEGLLGVGVADAEVLPLLESGFAHAGLGAFNPEGRSRQSDALYQLLMALAELARTDSFAAVEALARCPDFLAFLQARIGPDFGAARFLARLDDLHARHLPSDLAEAMRHAPESGELAAIAELRALLTTGDFTASILATLDRLFGQRSFNLSIPTDVLATESAEAWSDVMREAAAAATRFAGIAHHEWWEVTLRLYAGLLRSDDKPPGAVELQGWLELPWEDAPHLMVAGMNDGAVPDAVVGDAFLPESLRERLGLKTNEARFARDAYVLQALAACRATTGWLDLSLGKTSIAGDPLRPSRLLLNCPDAELPRRVAFLFHPVESARTSLPWRRAWQLHPPRETPPLRVGVTALRRWLECPFRFYLAQGLRMEAVEPEKAELDTLDFGTLCHAALEKLGHEAALRDCTDARVVREFLLAALETEATRRLGRTLTLPLVVQLESARQRLSRAADVHAQSRSEGWVVVKTEYTLDLRIGGLTVVGKIDRIDRHESTGMIRVLDYKTSDRFELPVEKHLRNPRRGEEPPEFARLAGERAQVWSDLQLPLYLRAIAEEFTGPAICGYFNLPKAATETGLALWEEYTPELAEAAWRCAQGVAAAIEAGQFWPPNETIKPDRDEFGALFHRGVAASIAWEGAP